MLSNKTILQTLRVAIVLGVVLVGFAGLSNTQLLAQDSAATDLTTLNDDDVSAYRWDAMADYYAVQPTDSNLTTLSDANISAYRWEAMADYYDVQPTDSGLTALSDDDVSAYRWEAMAEYYAGQSDLAAVAVP